MAVKQLSEYGTARRRGRKVTFQVWIRTADGDTIPSTVTGNAGSPIDVTALLPEAVRVNAKTVGYVRVSRTVQDTKLQIAAMNGVPCDLIFEEKVSGAKQQRSALTACLASLNVGDTLCVWKLDRLGRTTFQLLELLQDLDKRGIAFRSLTQSIDTSTPMGKAMIGMLAVFAEFERDMIIERTKAGLAVAEKKGHFGGRRRALTGKKLERAKAMYAERPLSPATGRPMTVNELAEAFEVSKPCFLRYVKHDGMPTWKGDVVKFLAIHGSLENFHAKTDDPRRGRNLEAQARSA